MANYTHILRKIKSVKVTARVTRALEVISSTHYYFYKDLRGKSLAYLRGIHRIFFEIFNDPEHDIKETNKKLISCSSNRRVLWIVLGTDIGMCGDLNDKLKNYLVNVFNYSYDGLIVFGNKLNYILSDSFSGFVEMASKSELSAKDLIDNLRSFSFQIFDIFMRGHYQKLSLIYLKNPKKGIIEKLNILPFTENYFSTKKQLFTRSFNAQFSYPDSVIEAFPRYLECVILNAFMNFKLEEHSTRRELMHNAHKNAIDLLDEYTLSFNRIRQENITREISEIVVASQLKKR